MASGNSLTATVLIINDTVNNREGSHDHCRLSFESSLGHWYLFVTVSEGRGVGEWGACNVLVSTDAVSVSSCSHNPARWI